MEQPREEESKGENQNLCDHQKPLEELCEKYGTDLKFGLSHETAKERLSQEGKNLMFPGRMKYELNRFFRCFFWEWQLVYWILFLVEYILFIILRERYNTVNYNYLLIGLVYAKNALFIGLVSYREGRQGKYPPDPEIYDIEVVRSGERILVRTEDLVVGDVVYLRRDKQIPADIRIIESQNFVVDNFALSGCHTQITLNEDLSEVNPVESPNLAFFSSFALEGSATGIVLRTGKRTLIGWMYRIRTEKEWLRYPVVSSVLDVKDKVTLLTLVLASTSCLIFFATSSGRYFTDFLTHFAEFFLLYQPYNLIKWVWMSYVIYRRKLKTMNCVTKNSSVIQRLPFISTLCLNKPGVLTRKITSVTSVWFDGRSVDVWKGGKISEEALNSNVFQELAFAAVLTNNAEVPDYNANASGTKRNLTGNPVDQAVLKFLLDVIGSKVGKLREAYPKLIWNPKETSSNFVFTIHLVEGNYQLILSGEPEFLLEKCTTYAGRDGDMPINEDFLENLDRACVNFSKFGDSIKCLIDMKFSPQDDIGKLKHSIPETGFRFLGLIAVLVQPRDNLIPLVSKCRKLGIRLILTTNDHPILAKTFAKQIGMLSSDRKSSMGTDVQSEPTNSIVIDGFQLKTVSVKSLEIILDTYSEIVFARVSPMMKVMIVATCQRNSMVAFLGDEVNDMFAMEKADVSVTLSENRGQNVNVKTDVTLTYENFDALLKSIGESRMVYNNLKKSLAYTLASKSPVVAALISYTLLGIPLPLHSKTVAISQIITDFGPIAALLFEKDTEEYVRETPPLLQRWQPIPKGLIFYGTLQMGAFCTAACFSTFFMMMMSYGWSPTSLFWIRDLWDSRVVNDLTDNYGQTWSYPSRLRLLRLSQTGYFYSLFVMEGATVLVLKSSKKSLFRLKYHNWFLYFSLLFEYSIMILVIYLPFTPDLTGLLPIHPLWWWAPFPFFLLQIAYDEFRKLIIRRSPGCWLERETVF